MCACDGAMHRESTSTGIWQWKTVGALCPIAFFYTWTNPFSPRCKSLRGQRIAKTYRRPPFFYSSYPLFPLAKEPRPSIHAPGTKAGGRGYRQFCVTEMSHPATIALGARLLSSVPYMRDSRTPHASTKMLDTRTVHSQTLRTG